MLNKKLFYYKLIWIIILPFYINYKIDLDLSSNVIELKKKCCTYISEKLISDRYLQ